MSESLTNATSITPTSCLLLELIRFYRGWLLEILVAGVIAASSQSIFAADHSITNAPAGDVLLLDNMGRIVRVSTNEVHPGFLPPADIGLQHQIPTPTRGASTPQEVLQRTQERRAGAEGVQFFPSVPPSLMPYLASQDEFGNTAFRHGALLPLVPFEPLVQGAKYRLSEYGFRYSLEQTVTYVNMSDVMNGDKSLDYYTFDFKAKWAVFDAPHAGTAGWISTQIEAKTGLGYNGQAQDARRNLGSITDPTGIWSSVNGLRVPELAWQQSLRNGEVVVVAGMVSQGNYFDSNDYAASGRGQFINSALIDTMVMPLQNYNFGLNVQWQPMDEYYTMVGTSAGNNTAGYPPWDNFNMESWSLIGEIGYIPRDFLGLGPGGYRIQPFVGGVNGLTQGGLCFNLQQQLGGQSPFGWFGRFGFGGSEISSGAAAQAGTGFVMHAPLKHAGLFPRLSNDLLGVGCIWSQPSATTKTIYHNNEYGLETFYTLQLSPTIRLQPDLQVIWNPAFNPNPDPVTVIQLQLVLAW